MVRKKEDGGVFEEPVTLQLGEYGADFLVGFEDTVVMMGDFPAHDRGVGVVRRHDCLGWIDGFYGPVLSSLHLDLGKEGLAFFAAPPVIGARVEPGPVIDEVVVILALVVGEVAGFSKELRNCEDVLRETDHAQAGESSSRIVPGASMVVDAEGRLHRASNQG